MKKIATLLITGTFFLIAFGKDSSMVKERNPITAECVARLFTEATIDAGTEIVKSILFQKYMTAIAEDSGDIDEHLGYEKHQYKINSNTCNGSSSKTLYTDDGEIEIETQRDCNGSLSHKTVKKFLKCV